MAASVTLLGAFFAGICAIFHARGSARFDSAVQIVARAFMETTTPQKSQHQFPCKDCGADLLFAPGTNCLKCPYCGAENCIPDSQPGAVQEEDFRATLANLAQSQDLQDTLAVKCVACGAESQFGSDVVSSKCPFCGAAIVATAQS